MERNDNLSNNYLYDFVKIIENEQKNKELEKLLEEESFKNEKVKEKDCVFLWLLSKHLKNVDWTLKLSWFNIFVKEGLKGLNHG